MKKIRSRFDASRRGFTLVEVVVASAISLCIVSAAVAFAGHASRLLGITKQSLDLEQINRASMDLLLEDLRHAGTGVGYSTDGSFPGLKLGAFNFDGASFNSNNNSVILSSGTASTDDIGIIVADGAYATIAHYSLAGTGQICAGSGISSGSLVMLHSDDGISGRSVIVGGITAAACLNGACERGCESFTWTADPSFTSDPSATSVLYAGGEMASGLKRIAWFVESSPGTPRIGNLRRAVFDNTHTCSARNASCGDLVADHVETVQTQIWRFDTTTSSWQNATTGVLDDSDRIRVDVEMVVRGRTDTGTRRDPAVLRLEPNTCIPGCSTVDGVDRRVVRGSAELRNSGRMRIR